MTERRVAGFSQVSGAVGGSLQSLLDSVDEHGRVAGAAAESSSFLRRRALAGVGTIARTGYPDPFNSASAGRTRRRLGDGGGLQDFGVNLMTLPPGAWSSHHLKNTFSTGA